MKVNDLLKSHNINIIDKWIQHFNNNHDNYKFDQGKIEMKDKINKICGFKHLWIIQTSGRDNNCLIHSFLMCVSPFYRKLNNKNKHNSASYFRKNIMYALYEKHIKDYMVHANKNNKKYYENTLLSKKMRLNEIKENGFLDSENLDLFEKMRGGVFKDGEHVLRLKIDMSHPNLVMRDPVIYRIRHAHHHRTGNTWCIYPLYDFTHCISDAIENITHSICTLEFENNRPLYEWILNELYQAGALKAPLPHQYEFARLNLTYTLTSKRKLLQLVQENYVDGWDDPRMPTIVGLRRRGYTPESLQLFCDRIGVSKADSWIDMSVLEQALRDDLDPKVERGTAVLSPLKLIIDNFNEELEWCSAPKHPHHEDWGRRDFALTKELWIESDDFMPDPPKGFFRLFPPKDGQPGSRVRLRYGFVVECTGYDIDENGNTIAVRVNYFPDSKSGTPGSADYKVKGNIHWVSVPHAVSAELRIYDRLFTDPHPASGDKDFLTLLNSESKKVLHAFVEPSLAKAKPEQRFQFERHGYFVADRLDYCENKPVFNFAVGLKDQWKK
jgi:glutaminyl-tRNA synthetase